MRVIGIDPGLRSMGWGVIDQLGSRLTHVANGLCKTEGKDLGALAAEEDPGGGHGAHVRHAEAARDGAELFAEPVAERAVLDAVLGDGGPVGI